MERLGGLGVHTLEELQTFSSRVSTAQRRKRHLAEGLPHSPGVYLFRDDGGRVLYVGTSRDLRTRVRTYFTASETRSRMENMVGLAKSVTGITCSTALEAEVRVLRLIAQHKPRYNRRSRFPERSTSSSSPARRGRGCRSSRRCSKTTPTTSARSVRARSPSGAWRRSTRRSRSGSASAGSRCCRPSGPRAFWRRWAAASRHATGASTGRPTPRWRGCCATRCCSARTKWSRRSTPGWPGSPRTSATRRRVSTGTASRRSCGPARAP